MTDKLDCLKPEHGKHIDVILSKDNLQILKRIVDLQNVSTMYMMLVLAGIRPNHLHIPCETCWRNVIMELRDMCTAMEELIGDKVKPK